MTDFDAVIYTDCRPGQGLSGGAGLQFQATSGEHVDAQAMVLVQQHLLYEPPASWMRDRRPVADYPPSLAHLGGTHLVTAAGVYLGREANGTREGNQLTHALITRDPQAYGLLRPAQLYGAPFWVTGPAPSTRCDPVPADPSPGVLDTETVHAFVRAHPDGTRLLAALVSVLSLPDDGRSPQVLFVADQVEPVLTWIAAATLLLPQRQALQIGFKVFTTAPTRAAQRVLAVHPAWDPPPASVDHPAGYLVVDLLAGRWNDTGTRASATRWAELFCTRDPFDVTDAVELAAGSGLDPEPAMSLALMAVLQEPPAPEHAEALVDWLSEGPADLVAAYGVPVAAAFTQDVAGRPLTLLRALDRATRGGGFEGRAVPVRLAWLAAELSAAQSLGRTVHEPVPPLDGRDWGDEHAAQAAQMVLSAARGARRGGFAAVLEVAGRFRIPVRFESLGDAATEFVHHWARSPEIPYRWSDWPCAHQIRDALRDHLNGDLAAGVLDPHTVGDGWHGRLSPMDPSAPLDAALVAATMAAGDAPQREQALHRLLSHATQGPDAARLVGALSGCLWRRTVPTRAELREVAAAAPAGTRLDATAVDRYLAEARRGGALAAADLALVHDLVGRGLLRPAPHTARLLDDDDRLRQLATALPALDEHDPALAGLLDGVSEAVLQVHRKALIEALLSSRVPDTACSVLECVPVAVQRDYAAAVGTRLKDGPAPSTVATAMVVLHRCSDQRVSAGLTAAVNKWVSWAGAVAVQRVSAMLRTCAHPGAYDRWIALLDENRIRRGRSWLRGSKGR